MSPNHAAVLVAKVSNKGTGRAFGNGPPRFLSVLAVNFACVEDESMRGPVLTPVCHFLELYRSFVVIPVHMQLICKIDKTEGGGGG